MSTKIEYAELFLSELCEYLKRKKILYNVAYRSWVDNPDAPIYYDNKKFKTYCDLAIFIIEDNKKINLFFNFKINSFSYTLDYRHKRLVKETKNGVRRNDADFKVASKTVKEDRYAAYIFALGNKAEENFENDYKKRILACGMKNKSTVVGAVIRNILEN